MIFPILFASIVFTSVSSYQFNHKSFIACSKPTIYRIYSCLLLFPNDNSTLRGVIVKTEESAIEAPSVRKAPLWHSLSFLEPCNMHYLFIIIEFTAGTFRVIKIMRYTAFRTSSLYSFIFNRLISLLAFHCGFLSVVSLRFL